LANIIDTEPDCGSGVGSGPKIIGRLLSYKCAEVAYLLIEAASVVARRDDKLVDSSSGTSIILNN